MVHSRTEPSVRAAFAVLASVQVTLIMAITLLAMPLPQIKDDLGLTDGELVLVNAGYGLMFSGLLLLGGRVSDVHPPRRILRFGLAGFALASGLGLAAGLADSFPTLLGARLMQGASAAFTAPAAMSLLGEVFPDPDRRRRAMGLWGGLSGAGAIIGMLLSGVVSTLADWRWVFVFPLASAIAAALAVPQLFAPPTQRLGRRPLDAGGAVLATLAVGGAAFACVQAPMHGWASPHVFMPAMLCLTSLAIFVVAESRNSDPLLPLGLLTDRRRLGAVLCIGLASAGTAANAFFLTLHLQEHAGRSLLATTAILAPGALILLTGPITNALMKQRGAPFTLGIGLGLGFAALLLIGTTSFHAASIGSTIAGVSLLAIATGLIFSSAAVLATEHTPAGRVGAVAGLVNTAMELGPSLGLAVLVTIATAYRSNTSSDGYAVAILTAAVAYAAAAALLLWLRHMIPIRPIAHTNTRSSSVSHR